MNAVVFVNGTITDADRASVAVFDHGFLFGEGIYETLRTYGREPFLLDRHLRRLRHSASLLTLEVPWSDADLLAAVRKTMDAQPGPPGRDEAYIRILVTRGVGDLSYNPAACPQPSLVIIVKPFPGQPERTFSQGITIALVSVRRNHPQALNPEIKSNNLINNALAMQEAIRRGAEEALMLNQAGELAECAQSNVFLVRGGAVRTPPLSAGLLPGVTREYVMELAASLGLDAREARLTPDDLQTADEVFITGTTREVTPVVAVDDHRVGAGTPGPITTKLLTEFRARVSGGMKVRSSV
jgi:branched-chain amino acid aminotransferase